MRSTHNRRVDLWRNCTSLLYFVVRVRCRRTESSRSLSHLLMSFLSDYDDCIVFQSIRDKLELRRSTVETSVRQGRMCRADEQDEEQPGLSTSFTLPTSSPAGIEHHAPSMLSVFSCSFFRSLDPCVLTISIVCLSRSLYDMVYFVFYLIFPVSIIL